MRWTEIRRAGPPTATARRRGALRIGPPAVGRAPITRGVATRRAAERERALCRARASMKRPMEAAGAVDAENAPTAPWKTRGRVSHSAHRPRLLERGHFYFAKNGDISISP